jgi:hypothetical protein
MKNFGSELVTLTKLTPNFPYRTVFIRCLGQSNINLQNFSSFSNEMLINRDIENVYTARALVVSALATEQFRLRQHF